MSKTPAQRARKHGERAAVAPSARPGARVPVPQATPRSPQAEGNPKLIIIAALGATVFMFWYLHLLALAQMTQLSSGLAMPDSMVAGFAPSYLEQLHGAMNAEALGQLSYVHKTAGTIFPLVFGLAFALVFGAWVRGRAARRAGFALVGAFVVVRIAGNIVIDTALGSQPFNTGLAALAAALVVAGWVLFALVLLLWGATALLSWRRKQAAAGEAA